MKKIFNVFGFLFLSVFSFNVSNAQQEAMKKTQDCLRNQTCETFKSAEGQKAEKKALESVNGDENRKQELFNISAEMMPILAEQAGGDDPSKMQEILMKAQQNPEEFFNSLPPHIRKQIQDMARKVEAERKPSSKP